MGVSARVAEWLRDEGHDVVHLRDENLHRLPNGEIFRKASEEDRIVLTFDLDFGEIAALTTSVTSVITFRLRNPRADMVIRRLEAVLAASAPKLEAGAIVSVEDARHRVRSMPIGRE